MIPTGRRARPGATGGKPAELTEPGRCGSTAGRSDPAPPARRAEADESGRPRPVRATGGAPTGGGRAACAEGRRGPRPRARDDGEPDGLRLAEPDPVLRALLHRPPPAEVQDARDGVRRRGRGGRLGRHGVRASATGSSASRATARTPSTSASATARRLAHMPAGIRFEEAAAVCDGALHRAGVPSGTGDSRGAEHRRVRRLRLHRHRGRPAREALRRARHGRLQREERRARPLARRRRGDRLRARGLHEERQDVRRRLRRGRQALVPALRGAR